jgi:hypothetical protein
LSESEHAELERLRREVTELRADREIPRKAAANFARETLRRLRGNTDREIPVVVLIQSGLARAPAQEANTATEPPPRSWYIIGLTRSQPVRAPALWSSSSGAPSK